MKTELSITRRRFLNKSVLATTGALIVPASALGGEGRTAPGERIAVGFIGTGKMAHDYHLPSILSFGDAQAVAVCDVDTNRRLHAKKVVENHYAKGKTSFAGCAAYNDFRELLARADIDAVVIATPDHWHAIPIILACQAGKDVYCEKPLTLTIREAEVCIRAVRKHKRVFQTGSQQRSGVFGEFPRACELIRNGRIGTVKKVCVGGIGGPSKWCDLSEEPLEAGLDWSLWLGQAPMRPYNSVLSPRGVHNHFPNWRAYREYSGGGFTDMGAHHFDIAQWALDMDNSGPIDVIPPDDPKAASGVRFFYANGVEMIHGGPGGCVFEGTAGKLRIDRGVLDATPESLLKEPLGPNDVHLPRNQGHHRDWIDCIRSRQRPICDVQVGARSVTVCHLGNLAYWNRRRLRWDPRNWSFASEETNQWLDRPRRDPWKLPRV